MSACCCDGLRALSRSSQLDIYISIVYHTHQKTSRHDAYFHDLIHIYLCDTYVTAITRKKKEEKYACNTDKPTINRIHGYHRLGPQKDAICADLLAGSVMVVVGLDRVCMPCCTCIPVSVVSVSALSNPPLVDRKVLVICASFGLKSRPPNLPPPIDWPNTGTGRCLWRLARDMTYSFRKDNRHATMMATHISIEFQAMGHGAYTAMELDPITSRMMEVAIMKPVREKIPSKPSFFIKSILARHKMLVDTPRTIHYIRTHFLFFQPS